MTNSRWHIMIGLGLMTTTLWGCTPSKSDGVMATAEKASAQLPGVLGAPAAMALPPLVASESATGEMLAAVSANTDSVIKTAGSTKGSAAFKEVALAVPKGALSGTGTLTIAEGSSLASPILAEALGIAEVAQASPTVIINASAVSIVNPLTIALPMGVGLNLDGGLLQVVAIVPGIGNSQTLNVIPADKIKVTDSAVYAEITQFGAYQAVRTSSQPTTTTAPTTLAPVKSPGGGATTTEIGAALLLASPEGLPNCTQVRQGALYYILSLKQFQTCDAGAWVLIDLKGPKGDTGSRGEVGATGLMGPKAPDPVPYFSTQSSLYKFVDGKFIYTSIDTQYENYGGAVLRVCKIDIWQESVTNGVNSKTRSYGDASCPQSTTSWISCQGGYVEIGGQCVAGCSNDSLSQCNSQALCEASQMIWDADSNSCKGSCSETNLGACLTEIMCRSRSLPWVDGQCQSRCSGDDLSSCTSEVRCTVSGMVWSGTACLGYCNFANPEACNTEAKCKQYNLTWGASDSNISDQKCLGQCYSDNLKACNTLALCQQSSSNFNPKSSFYPGYWNNGRCQESCDAGQMATASGCQDIVKCGVDEMGLPKQWQANNSCATVDYTVIEPTEVEGAQAIALHGEYQGPHHIKSGSYEVTGDTTFFGAVVIDPGTRLIATGSYQLSFKRNVQVRGTESNRVIFETKDENTKWRSFEFYNIHDYSSEVYINPFQLDGTYFTGTKVEHLTITGAAGASMTLAGHFNGMNISGVLGYLTSTDQSPFMQGLRNANGIYLAHSILSIPTTVSLSYSNSTVLFDNDFLPGGPNFYFQSGLVWGNRFASGSGSIQNLDRGIVIFNTMDSIYCGGMAFGNLSREVNANETHPSCVGSDNVVGIPANQVSSKSFVYWHGDQMNPVRKGAESNKYQVTVLTADGVAASSSVNWVVEYVNNMGTKVKVKEAIGDSFSFTPPEVGTYTLKITSVDSSQELMGVLRRDFSINY